MLAAEEALIGAGISVEELMERAGTGAADWVWRVAAGRAVTVLCGPGNNGGDGYVIARVLAARGLTVKVIAPMAPQTSAAKAARASWGGTPVEFSEGSLLVDCLFGTGLKRPLSDDLHGLLMGLSRAHDHAIAVDLPSGVASDSGRKLHHQFPTYACTLALGAWKYAHWLMPASEEMGTRKLVDIGIGAVAGAAHLVEQPKLYPPSACAHKYTRGFLAIVAGAMPGAAVLAARAAMHGGAGYVKLLGGADTPPDLVCDARPLEQALSDDRITALLIGPGLGRDASARERLMQVLAADRPTVLDADALHLLEPALLKTRQAPLIATPHSGELSALSQRFGIASSDKVAITRELAETMQATIIAKGADTLIASPGHPLCVTEPASSWLSTAGTGDVLAGLAASRLATGAQAHDAALEAAALHGEAARLAGPAFTASNLIDHIPHAFARFL